MRVINYLKMCAIFSMLFLFHNMATAQIENAPCNAVDYTPFISSTFDGLEVISSNTGWPFYSNHFSNIGSLTDSNVNNSAYAGGFIGIDATIGVKDNNNTYPGGTWAGFNVNLVNVSAGDIGTITIMTYLNNEFKEGRSFTSANIVELNGRMDLGFLATEEFNWIKVRYQGAAFGIPGIEVYHPIITRFCANEDLACNELRAIHRTDDPVFLNDENTGTSGLSLSIVTGTESLITPSTTDYANLTNVTGIAGSAFLSVKNAITDYPAGTYAGYEIQNINVIGLEVFQHFEIVTFLDGTPQESRTGSSLLVDVSFFDFSRQTVGFISTLPFDEIQIRRNQPIGTNIGTTRVYNAVVKRPCEGADLACNEKTKINSPAYPVSIDIENTGVSGLGCIGCQVDNAVNVIDTDASNYATIAMPGGIGISGSISAKKALSPWEAGTFAGFEIRNPTIATATLAQALTIETRLNGALQESSTDFNLFASGSSFVNGDNNAIVGFETTQPYDEVIIRITRVGSLDLGITQVYNLVIQNFCPANLDCNDFVSASAPEYPVFINAKNTGINSAACGSCSLSGTEAIIDGDKSTYAELQITAGALASGTASVKIGGLGDVNVMPAGSYAGFDVENFSLLNADFLSVMAITTFLNGTQQESISGQGILFGTGSDLVGETGRATVGIVSQLPFDEVKIDFFNTASGDIGVTRIYDFELAKACPATIDCNASFYWSRPDFPVVLNAQRTGVQGAACGGAVVYEPDNIINNGTADFSRIQIPAGVACTGSLSVVDIASTYPAGTYAGYTIDDQYFPLQSDILEFITIRTYLDGILQESRTAFDLVDITLLIPIWGTGTRNVGFYTTQPFDEVEIEVASLASALNIVDVYGAFIDTRSSIGGNDGSLSCYQNTTTATNDINDTPKGVAVSGNLLTNDFDLEGDSQTINTTPVSGPSNGTVVINADGTYTYTPNPDFTGEDSFTYEVCDDGNPSVCDQATVTINVIAPPVSSNNPPVAGDDVVTTPIGTPVTSSVLGNDSDVDGDNLTVTTTPVSGPSNGTVVLNEDGTYTYTPNDGFTGEDTFEYEVCDDATPKACTTATVTITVPEDPTLYGGNVTYANDDAGTALEGQPITGGVLTNDTDPEGNVQTVNTTPVSGPSNGTLVLNADGTYTYTPNADYVGNDEFVYEVCDNGTPQACDKATVYLTVMAEANTTDAVADINDTPQDSPVSGNVLTNDEDPQGDTQTVNTTPVSGPSNGTVVLNEDGSYTYTPNDGFTGEDMFKYEVCDNGTPSVCDTAEVTINVLPLLTTDNNPPVAGDDVSTTPEGTPVTSSVLGNDSDPDGDDLTVTTTPVSEPTNGTVVLNEDGTYTYTPNDGFTGEDTFEYEVCDNATPKSCTTAEVTVTVTEASEKNETYANDDANTGEVNDPQSGNVLTNDTDPEGNVQTVNTTPVSGPSNGTVVLNADGSYTYTPNADFVGNDEFVYEVCDNGTPQACDQATVYLTVMAEANTTDAVADINDTPQDSPVSGNVLTNDEDPQGDTQTVNTTPVSGPSNGTVVLNEDGSYTYTPNDGFTGEDMFKYEVCDNGKPSVCDTAEVTINVLPLLTTDNNTPVAGDDVSTTPEGTPVTSSVLGNDSDPDGDDLTVTTTPVSEPTNGTVVLNEDGTYTYTPNDGFTGEDTFEYEVCDNATPKSCTTAEVTVTVTEANEKNETYANDDANTGEVNDPQSGNVLTNDTDPEGNTQTVNTTPVSGPSNGTVVLNEDGSYTYTPNADYVGNDEFVYEVCDNGTPQACDKATVYLTVMAEAVNTTDAVDDAVEAPVFGAKSGNVLTNDVDDQNHGQTVTGVKYDTDGDGVADDVVAVGTTVTVYGTRSDNSVIPAGTLVVNTDGSFTFTANGFFAGTVPAIYTITDDYTDNPATDDATLTITVGGTNAGGGNPPVAVDDAQTVPQGSTTNYNVIANDTDADETDPASVLVVVGATGLNSTGGQVTLTETPQDIYDTNGVLAGQASLDPDQKNIIFTAAPNYTGDVAIEYEVSDTDAGTVNDMGTYTITVVALPDLTPLISAESTTLDGGQSTDVLISFFNANEATTDVSEFFISLPIPTLSATVDYVLQSSSFGSLDNDKFDWTDLGGGIYKLTSKANVFIGKFESLRIGVSLTAEGVSQSTGTITAIITNGTGGGESPTTNNTRTLKISVN